MPHHACAAVARHAAVHTAGPIGTRVLLCHVYIKHPAGAYRFFHCRINRVKLMVARHDFVQRAGIGVYLEDNEMLQEIKKPPAFENPAHQHL